MPKNPVAYAEDVLNVHGVYGEARELTEALEDARARHSKANVSVRNLRERLADEEARLTLEARGENPDLSATAFERQLRLLLQEDEGLRSIRRQILEAQAVLDETEAEYRVLDRRIDVATARLVELGGLLHFYAAARSSQPTTT